MLFDYTKHVLIHQNKVSVSFCVVLENSLLIKEENINHNTQAALTVKASMSIALAKIVAAQNDVSASNHEEKLLTKVRHTAKNKREKELENTVTHTDRCTSLHIPVMFNSNHLGSVRVTASAVQ